MNILPIGIGNAGNRLVEKFLSRSESNGYHIPGGIALDVHETELYSINKIQNRNCILLDNGDSRFDDQAQRPLFEIQENHKNAKQAVDRLIHDRLDCFFVIGGLGGQLGSHAGMVVRWLQEHYDRPTYGLGILPTEEEGDLAAACAIEGLDSLQRYSNGVLLFDNNARASGKNANREQTNAEIVNRIGTIFWAAESAQDSVHSPVTTEKLHEVLSTGDYITCGYASVEIGTPENTVLSRFKTQLAASKEERQKNKNRIREEWINRDRRNLFSKLARKSTDSKLTFPISLSDIAGSHYALIIVVGNPAILVETNLKAAQVGFEEFISPSLENISAKKVETASFGLEASQLAVITLFSVSGSVSRLDKLRSMAQRAPSLTGSTQEEEIMAEKPRKSLTDRLRSIEKATWKKEDLLSISAEEFENLIAELYRSVGDNSKVTQKSHDGGVDVIVDQQPGTRLVVQVKQYQLGSSVGRPTVQQTIGVREAQNASVAVVVSSSHFSQPAMELADTSGDSIRLISGKDLIDSLNESALKLSDFLKS
jgi:cell division GTPase FtsZ